MSGYTCPTCPGTGELEHRACNGHGCVDCDSGGVPCPSCNVYVLVPDGRGRKCLVETTRKRAS